MLVNARVAVIGDLPAMPQEPDLPQGPAAVPRGTRLIHLGGTHEAPIYSFDRLTPGQIIKGPAIVESATTTILLRPGDLATTTAFGWLDVKIGGR